MSKSAIIGLATLILLAGVLGWGLAICPWETMAGAALLALSGVFFWRTEAAFYFLVAYLPWQLALNLAPDIDLLSGRVLILLLFLVWLIKAVKSGGLKTARNQVAAGLILILAVSLISLLVAQNPIWGARKWLVFASVFPLFFLTKHFISDWEKARQLIWVMSGSAALAALAALGQFLSQFIWGLEKVMTWWGGQIAPWFLGWTFTQSVTQNPSWLVEVGGQTIMRAIGLFPDPHMLAFFVGLVAPLSLALMINEKGKRAWLLFFINCLFLVVLSLTFSRGGYLGLALGLMAMGITAWRHLAVKEKKFLGSFSILALIFILLFGVPVLGRFFSSFDLAEGSNLGRLAIWQESWAVFKTSPILGVGLGNYPLALDFDAGYRSAVTSHNLYLDILAETGLLGLAAWGWFGCGFLRGAARKIKNQNRALVMLGSGVLGSGIYFLAHSFFETAIFNPTILAYLMIVAGLGALSLKKISKN